MERAVTIDFSVYDGTLINLVGESILRGSVSDDQVRIQLELEDGGRRELRFDEQGRIRNWPVAYFEVSAPYNLEQFQYERDGKGMGRVSFEFYPKE